MSESELELARLVTKFDADWSGYDRGAAHVEAITQGMITRIERSASRIASSVLRPFDAMGTEAAKQFASIETAATKAASVVEIASNKIRDAKGRFASAAALPMASLITAQVAKSVPTVDQIVNSLPSAAVIKEKVAQRLLTAQAIPASIVQGLGVSRDPKTGRFTSTANQTLPWARVLPTAQSLPPLVTGYGGFSAYTNNPRLYGGLGQALIGSNPSGNLSTGFGGFANINAMGSYGGLGRSPIGREGYYPNFASTYYPRTPVVAAGGYGGFSTGLGYTATTSGYGGFAAHAANLGNQTGFGGLGRTPVATMGSGYASIGYGGFASGLAGVGAAGAAARMAAAVTPGRNAGFADFMGSRPPPIPPDYTIRGGGGDDFWRGRGGSGGGGRFGGLFTGAMDGGRQFVGFIDQIAEHTGAFADRMSQYGSRISLGFGVPLGMVGRASVKEFLKFDEAMNKAFSIMEGDTSPAMMGQLSGKAKELSSQGIISPDKIAESYYFLASAGYEAERALAAIPVVEKFATAGMFEMADATRYLVDAQAALGMTIREDSVKNMENMTRVADVLVKANMMANATTEEFSQALTNKAGAALRLLNKDVEEGVAVLAAYAEQGVKGMIAGEKLNIILRDLQTASLRNSEAWAEMGLQVYDASGNMLKVPAIIKQLETAFSGLSDEQIRTSLMTLGFQDRSVAAIAQLLGMSDEIERFEKGLRSAGGTMQEVAERRLQSFQSQLTNLWNNLKLVGIEIGEALVPSFQSMNVYIRQGIDLWKGLSAETKTMIANLGLLTVVAGPVLYIFGRMLNVSMMLVRDLVSIGRAILWIGTTGVPAIATWVAGFAAAHPVILTIVAAVATLALAIEGLGRILGVNIWEKMLAGAKETAAVLGVIVDKLVAVHPAAEAIAGKKGKDKKDKTVWEMNELGQFVERNAEYVPPLPDIPRVTREWEKPENMIQSAYDNYMHQFFSPDGNGGMTYNLGLPKMSEMLGKLPGGNDGTGILSGGATAAELSVLNPIQEKMDVIDQLIKYFPHMYAEADRARLMEEKIQTLNARFAGPTMVDDEDNSSGRNYTDPTKVKPDNDPFVSMSTKLAGAAERFSADAFSTMVNAMMAGRVDSGNQVAAGPSVAVNQSNAPMVAAQATQQLVRSQAQGNQLLREIRDNIKAEAPEVLDA